MRVSTTLKRLCRHHDEAKRASEWSAIMTDKRDYAAEFDTAADEICARLADDLEVIDRKYGLVRDYSVLRRPMPDWEGHKVGITCRCGGQLTTITDEFTIVAGDTIGPDEIVRCERCGAEYDADNHDEATNGG
jgi:hypothetical protein